MGQPPVAPTRAELHARLEALYVPRPDPYESFPRRYWRDTSALFDSPPYRPVMDDHMQVTRAARNASKAWLESQGAVDDCGFLLAVTAKAMEL